MYKNVMTGRLTLKGISSSSQMGEEKKKKKKSDKKEKKLEKKTKRSKSKRKREIGDQKVEDEEEWEKRKRSELEEEEQDEFDGLTPAQRKFEMVKRKREMEQINKMISKTHREKIEEFNVKLSRLSEHHDIPKVSAAGNG